MGGEFVSGLHRLRFGLISGLTIADVQGAERLFPNFLRDTKLVSLYLLLRGRMNDEEKEFFEAIGLHVEGFDPAAEVVSKEEPGTRVADEPASKYRTTFSYNASNRMGQVIFHDTRDGTDKKICYITPIRWKTFILLAELQLAAGNGWVSIHALTEARVARGAVGPTNTRNTVDQGSIHGTKVCLRGINSSFCKVLRSEYISDPPIERDADDAMARIRADILTVEGIKRLAEMPL